MTKYILIILAITIGACAPKTKKTTGTATIKKDIPLIGPKWMLKKINDDMQPYQPDGQVLWLQLLLGGTQFSAYGGCNSGAGMYNIEKNSIRLTEMVSTKMYCEPNMKLENAFFGKLQQANRYELKGNSLSLFYDKTFLLEFEAAE
jgi:heat shock protein HslJ